MDDVFPFVAGCEFAPGTRRGSSIAVYPWRSGSLVDGDVTDRIRRVDRDSNWRSRIVCPRSGVLDGAERCAKSCCNGVGECDVDLQFGCRRYFRLGKARRWFDGRITLARGSHSFCDADLVQLRIAAGEEGAQDCRVIMNVTSSSSVLSRYNVSPMTMFSVGRQDLEPQRHRDTEEEGNRRYFVTAIEIGRSLPRFYEVLLMGEALH